MIDRNKTRKINVRITEEMDRMLREYQSKNALSSIGQGVRDILKKELTR
jgi:hypothetical protein|tara:strand:- start:81 stop:227 length:147 start_codon:yes stop_codon:yes gene_type:complete